MRWSFYFIEGNTRTTEVFLKKLLLNENNELHSRNLHINGLWNNEKVDIDSLSYIASPYYYRMLGTQKKELVENEMKDIEKPDISNEESVREYFRKIEDRSKRIAEMPDHVIPMNFHLYEIRIDKDSLEIAIEYNWNIFGISYSGKRKVMKQFKKISKDLYRYYGVSEDDIKRKTERYSSLIMALSS